MKTLKRLFLALLVLSVAGWLLRGKIYRGAMVYKPVKQRINYPATNEKLISFIEAEFDTGKAATANDIIKRALAITSGKLTYTAGKNETDPNRLIEIKTAHCVGYAAFCSSVCNYLFKKYGFDKWAARPMAGHLYLFGTDIHKFFKSSFFKDHDFVLAENTATGETIAVDPTVHDYLFINHITYRK